MANNFSITKIVTSDDEGDADDPDEIKVPNQNEQLTITKAPVSKPLENENKKIPNAALDEVVLLDSDDEKEKTPVLETTPGTISSKPLDCKSDSDSSIEEIMEEKPKKKIHIMWQCLNPDCTKSKKESLSTASQYILSYFGKDYDQNKKRKVCGKCQDMVDRGKDHLVKKIKDKKPLLEESLPVPEETFELGDSDEDMETDDSDESLLEWGGEGSEDSGSDVSSLSEDGNVEKQFNKAIEKALIGLNFDFQVTEADKHIGDRLDSMKPLLEETDKMFDDLEKDVDSLRKELYSDYTPKYENLPEIDINKMLEAATEAKNKPKIQRLSDQLQPNRDIADVRNVKVENKMPILPPEGPLERQTLKPDETVLVMRNNILQPWKYGQVSDAEAAPRDGGDHYRVKLEAINAGKKGFTTRTCSAKHLAYNYPAKVKLKVGTRCIGLFKENMNPNIKGAFYSGIIAEPPKVMNKFRYLVFFDDGYASYIPHTDVRVVCEASNEVWKDIHPNSKDFIKSYLNQYPERPMVKLSVGQVVKTEWDGKWWKTRVVVVDASLVKLMFDADARTEWIYRGSTRLGPLFTEMEQQRQRRLQAQEQGTTVQRRNMHVKRQDAPYVEYTRQTTEPDPEKLTASKSVAGAQAEPVDSDGAPKRAVARKSTAGKRSENPQPGTLNIIKKCETTGGNIFHVDCKPKDSAEVPKLKKHQCDAKCIADPKYQYEEERHRGTNPLLIPVVLGWMRIVSRQKNKGIRKVFYHAPCGRRLKNLEDVHRYLRITGSEMEMDFFNFEWFLHVYNEYETPREQCKMQSIKDLSYGKENVPISCINSIDRNFPEYVDYSTIRLPQKNVNLNVDPEFLCGCDCEDDCQDKTKCACWQLTIKATAADAGGNVNPMVGYQYRRLQNGAITGIYECNSQCHCKKTCLNRVVQNPLRQKLQVFKTESRGWGLRTLVDMPKGTFICTYVGNLYENNEGNKQGQNFGDEYFAELDLIENIERRKDGYESDVSDIEADGLPAITPPKTVVPIFYNYSSTVGEGYSSDESSGDEKKSKNSKGYKGDKDFSPLSHQRKVNAFATERTTRQKTMEHSVPQLDGGDSVFEFSEGDDGSNSGLPAPARRRGGGFTVTTGMTGPKKNKTPTKVTTGGFKSLRKLFGKDEDAYIMDAKSIGNVGRYLNHSCGPNAFVQSVFVDTHDPRFHWVAFFTSAFVKAGEELCWDYQYEIGSVPGKELFCTCGSHLCKGRFL